MLSWRQHRVQKNREATASEEPAQAETSAVEEGTGEEDSGLRGDFHDEGASPVAVFLTRRPAKVYNSGQ
jgi:hypothetical protein